MHHSRAQSTQSVKRNISNKNEEKKEKRDIVFVSFFPFFYAEGMRQKETSNSTTNRQRINFGNDEIDTTPR